MLELGTFRRKCGEIKGDHVQLLDAGANIEATSECKMLMDTSWLAFNRTSLPNLVKEGISYRIFKFVCASTRCAKPFRILDSKLE